MLFDHSDPAPRLTRRSLLISSATTSALLAMPLARAATTFAQTPAATTPLADSVFFDSSLVHDIAATFDQADYDAMIAAYQESGDKQWIKASLTIDGQTFDDVGLRLKGNSSLMALRGNGPKGGAFDDGAPTLTIVTDGTPVVIEVNPSDQAQTAQGDTVVRGAGGNISADEPQGLPWLVRLDKYLDDQHMNGLTEFVIRSNNSQTALNEAVALDLLARAGLASQAAAYVRLAANDSDPKLRLAIENPDDTWMDQHFPDTGTLFKSEADGSWAYQDDDLDAYMQSFDLEAGGEDDDQENYAPLISFLDFLNNSDDAAFASDLPDRLDVDRFAVYLAMMDLIQNGDDIDGPGNNSYLFYDDTTGIFTVVPWDMNLAFGSMGGFGGRTFPGGQGPNSAQLPDGVDIQDGQLVIDGTPVTGQMRPPTNAAGTPVAGGEDSGPSFTGPDGQPVGSGGPGGPGGMRGMNNPLSSRWAAVDAFTTMQADARTRLAAELFQSGVAARILSGWVTVLETHATDLLDQSTIDGDSQPLQEQIDAV